MEHFFKIAIWMILLTGPLQAQPVNSANRTKRGHPFRMSDLGFSLLKMDVSCGQNVSFTTPTYVMEHCRTAALEVFTEGLEQAMQNCTGEHRTDQTLAALEDGLAKYTRKCPQPIKAKPSVGVQVQGECKWDDAGSHMPFADFVDRLENLVQELNNCKN